MKPITSEWIAKAEGDFATAQRELAAADNPNYDAVSLTADLNTLSAFAVEYRYPGDSADLDEAPRGISNLQERS